MCVHMHLLAYLHRQGRRSGKAGKAMPYQLFTDYSQRQQKGLPLEIEKAENRLRLSQVHKYIRMYINK